MVNKMTGNLLNELIPKAILLIIKAFRIAFIIETRLDYSKYTRFKKQILSLGELNGNIYLQ